MAWKISNLYGIFAVIDGYCYGNLAMSDKSLPMGQEQHMTAVATM